MSNTKPYLFGAVLGASAMYVALQYHVVHSHDGFLMVPRTPQHSVGLAYADVRNWSPSQWTDRPELARALMAHGSSDLISESVANSLADSVTEENSTLDQLRTFLDQSAQDGVKGDATGLLEIPITPLKPESTDSGADDVLTRIPFPPEAKNNGLVDPFSGDPLQVAQRPKSAEAVQNPPRPVGVSKFSAADVIEGLRDDANNHDDSFSVSAPRSTSAQSTALKSAAETAASARMTPAQQAQAIEDRIFGNSSATSQSSKPATESDDVSMFEEVSTQLESRAQAALNRAKEQTSEKAGSVPNSGSKSSEAYTRKPIQDAAPDAVKSVIKSNPAATETKPTESVLDQFDPFLE
jgi:vacuolar-type H+-ATPase subunit H